MFVTVDKILSTLSDSVGFFKVIKDFKIIQLSHLSFKPLILSREDIRHNILYLEENNEVLDEIVISNKNERRILLPSNNYKNLFKRSKGAMANHNTVYATFIPNLTSINGLIKKIII